MSIFSMRLSISHKVLIIFSLLSLVTIFLGTVIYYTNNKLAKSNERIKTINEFKISITELGQQHAIAAAATKHFPYEKYAITLKNIEELVEKIDEDQPTDAIIAGNSFSNVKNQIKYYRNAAEELFDKLKSDTMLFIENASIIQEILAQNETIPSHNQTNFYYNILMLENIWDEIYVDHDISKIPSLKKLQFELSQNVSYKKIDEKTDHFIKNAERYYINLFAIKNRLEFLNDTENRFMEIANSNIQDTADLIEKKQKNLEYLIISLVIFSVILTLFLWFLVSRQVTLFLNNMNLAVNSIRNGEHDFDSPNVSEDELGDVFLLLQHLSQSLKEEIIVRRRAEKEKLTLQEQLHHSQKIESIGRLAGGVAHDFNNILTGITGYSELALLKTPADQPVRNYISLIHENALKAAGLTKKLLAFSRKQLLEKKVVNLNTIVNNVVAMLQRIIGEDIILDFKLKDSLRNIFADISQIEQILMNLSVNARDAMPNGGRLLIETTEVEIGEDFVKHHNGMEETGSYVMVSVSDTGIGMPKQILEKIFDPFFTTKEIGKGTGLGLATVYGTVKQHNGHIWVYSEPEHGTTFKVYLPIVEGEAVSEENHLNVHLAKGDETLLVVDDEDSIRSLIRDTLAPLGYTLLEASNGQEALELCRQKKDMKIDLLLTDIIMPGMNGNELSVAVQKNRPDIKVLFMSGYADNILNPHDISEDMELHFIPKPLTPTTLTRKVRELLD